MTGFTALAQKKATISFKYKDYDLGKIKEDDGARSGKFELTNTGNDTLKILNVSSGNGNIICTWTKTPIPPKGSGFVEAKFDPKGRPGSLSQVLTVNSNDVDLPYATLTLKAEVEAHQKTEADNYPNPIGNLRFINSQIAIQNINNTDQKTDTLKMYNDWGKPMNLSFTTLPEYITCKAIPEVLNPKQKGYILVTYDAAKRKDFGYIYDRFSITTNDTNQAEKAISISANIVEDFSKLTPQQLKDAAKIKFETLTYNFDTLTEGKDIEYDFKFTNTGKEDLFIRKVKGS
jgi:hypothetical protein